MGRGIIVLQIENTCWQYKPYIKQEVIEIGAYRLNNETKPINTFHSLVRPTINPELSEFCKKLTKIPQEELNKANVFNDVIYNFEMWAKEGYTFVSWGKHAKELLLIESRWKNFNGMLPYMLENYIDLKELFCRTYKINKRYDIRLALRRIGLELEGDYHRAKDDAKNVVRILQYMYEKGDIQFGKQKTVKDSNDNKTKDEDTLGKEAEELIHAIDQIDF